MSAIMGFCNFRGSVLENKEKNSQIIEKMGKRMAHRGSLKIEIYQSDFVCMGASRPSYLESVTNEPFVKFNDYAVAYDGTIYNKDEVLSILASEGHSLKGASDEEILFTCFKCYGYRMANIINGVFSVAIWDETFKELYLVRDRMGIKPLSYTIQDDTLVFSSEIKGLFEFPNVKPSLDKEGLCEILGLFPSKKEGFGVFKDVFEIKPGHFGIYKNGSFNEYPYWQLQAEESKVTEKGAIELTRYLVEDAVKKQMVSDVPICSLLSGGIDSSIVSAILNSEMNKSNKTLDTFSFDYEENENYFKSHDFQDDTDKKWAIKVSDHLKTNHNFVECSLDDLVNELYPSVIARDFPLMADIDSSMIFFCKQVTKSHKVALTGECADEIFGGYRWFHDEESINSNFFPWVRQLDFRKSLLNKDLLTNIDIDAHVTKRYEDAVKEVPMLDSDTVEDKKRRKIAYLNLRWVLANLRDRGERCAAFNGMDARVPFADYRIVEFVYNLPWEIKCDKIPKSLLRKAFSDVLPEEIVYRKKSAFPKTYHPRYESMVKCLLKEILEDSNSPILSLIDKESVAKFIDEPGDVCKPWYGQLMAAPQLVAFYVQLNYWLKAYKVSF